MDGSALDAMHTPPWIGPEALQRQESDLRLCAWLQSPGLLTQRIRETVGDAFSFEALREYSTAAAHVREVALRAGEAVWVVGRTTIPLAGLRRAAWLAEVGSVPIGEALQARVSGLERSPFEFCRIPAGHEFAYLALGIMGLERPWIWVRRSRFQVDGALLEIHEAFNPGIGVLGPEAAPATETCRSARQGG